MRKPFIDFFGWLRCHIRTFLLIAHISFGLTHARDRCIDCGNSYHEKCAVSVPKNCAKYKAIENASQTLTRSQGDNGSIASSATTGQASSQMFYEQYRNTVPENRTHEG